MKESQLQRSIEDYLAILERQSKLVYIKNNTGAMQTSRGGFYRFGKVGSPDFFIFLNGGACLHLEIKTEKGRQSETQKEYEKAVSSLSHKYSVARSLDDVMKILAKLN